MNRTLHFIQGKQLEEKRNNKRNNDCLKEKSINNRIKIQKQLIQTNDISIKMHKMCEIKSRPYESWYSLKPADPNQVWDQCRCFHRHLVFTANTCETVTQVSQRLALHFKASLKHVQRCATAWCVQASQLVPLSKGGLCRRDKPGTLLCFFPAHQSCSIRDVWAPFVFMLPWLSGAYEWSCEGGAKCEIIHLLESKQRRGQLGTLGIRYLNSVIHENHLSFDSMRSFPAVQPNPTQIWNLTHPSGQTPIQSLFRQPEYSISNCCKLPFKRKKSKN